MIGGTGFRRALIDRGRREQAFRCGLKTARGLKQGVKCGTFVLLGIILLTAPSGCGPAVPREELGEILLEVPPELQFQSPYPVPWQRKSEGDMHESEAETPPEPFAVDSSEPATASAPGDTETALPESVETTAPSTETSESVSAEPTVNEKSAAAAQEGEVPEANPARN